MGTFTLTLTDPDLVLIATAIKKMPWETAQPLLEKLHAQLQSQQAEPPAPPAVVEKPPVKAKANGKSAHP